MTISATFIGTGTAINDNLGNACCVIEKGDVPWLMIDCGPDALPRYSDHYQGLPRNLFITHLHFDHIGGLEQLFFQSALQRQRPRIFMPASIVADATHILSNSSLAEGGVNLWDALDIVPVLDRFWLDEHEFRVHAVRHHKPNSAYGIQLPGVFFYTGDTRPIPELLTHTSLPTEYIFHDCGLQGNPSHTGADDIHREYSDSLKSRVIAYHYSTLAHATQIEASGIRAARPGERFTLSSRMNADNVTSIAREQA